MLQKQFKAQSLQLLRLRLILGLIHHWRKVKIGLKFGATNTISKNISYTVTKTLGNDELGEVIVNFADKILKSKNNVSTSRNWKPDYIDKYKTGWYQLAVSPLKYN